MEPSYWISLDVHSRTCEYVTATPGGRVLERGSVDTQIAPLVAVIKQVRRPRTVVFEEGPLADWLYRELGESADAVVVCDPRRNHLIARDGDKDDPLDAQKLLELARGGYVRPVHHSGSLGRSVFKHHVSLYHDRVQLKVSEANKVIWFVRRFGVVVRERAFADAAGQSSLLSRLPSRRTVQHDARGLLDSYDMIVQQVETLGRDLVRQSRRLEPVRRFCALPGVRWIRAATFYAYVDTPFRFRNKSSLCKYMGIGLERRQSGSDVARLSVPRRCNRALKNMILGAAHSAAASKDNPFAEQYERSLHDGHSPDVARRTVARSLASVMWGMWKSNSTYRADWVGRSVAMSDGVASPGSSLGCHWTSSPEL